VTLGRVAKILKDGHSLEEVKPDGAGINDKSIFRE
jgi:hypothetical protein